MNRITEVHQIHINMSAPRKCESDELENGQFFFLKNNSLDGCIAVIGKMRSFHKLILFVVMFLLISI